MVLDLDVIIAKLSGFPIFTAPTSWADAGLRWRNGRLSLLGYVSSRWPAAWLIVAEPRDHWRQWWVDKMRARVVVLETSNETCRQRLLDDARRPPPVMRKSLELVDWWWSSYRRRPDDMIITEQGRATTGSSLVQAFEHR